MRAWLSVYLKGVFMGAADAVPGVSGGTIALITGIYERLVDAIASVDLRIVESLARSYDPAERARIRELLVSMDVTFLLVLGAGIATALVAVTRVVEAARDAVPALMFAFFFGLIAASAVVLYDEVSVDTAPRVAAAILGFAIAFLVAGISTEAGGLPPTLLLVFLTGSIAIAAMILPGVSGAFLLLLLGQYTYMTETLTAFTNALVELASGGTVSAVVGPGVTVVAFLLGAGLGLLTVAHAVSWALERYREVTLTFLVSLMVGALRLPAARVLEHAGAWTLPTAASVLLAAAVGGGLVLVADRYTDDLDYTAGGN